MTRKNQKYHLDPNTLTFIPVQKDIKAKKRSVLKYAIVITVLSISGFFFLTNFRLTPHEYILAQKNEKITENILAQESSILSLRDSLNEIMENDDVIYRPFAEIRPIPKDIREAGVGGVNRYSDLAGIDNSDNIIGVLNSFDKLERQIQVQNKSFDEVEELVSFIDQYYAAKPGIRPISKKDELFISSPYGRRFHPIYKRFKMHHGIDYAAQIGTPVYATGKGVVKVARYASGYGKVIKINHGFGYMSIYAHLNKYIVSKGDTIQRGQLIGYVGNTGISTGPHLHYEIRKNNRTQNPLYFYIDDLKEEEYQKIVSK
ncbi:MAG: peptidase M23 [Salinivirgaceae bacterium]|nr:MAG: peptidase M23 [Salinivirgaceae bacterium]